MEASASERSYAGTRPVESGEEEGTDSTTTTNSTEIAELRRQIEELGRKQSSERENELQRQINELKKELEKAPKRTGKNTIEPDKIIVDDDNGGSFQVNIVINENNVVTRMDVHPEGSDRYTVRAILNDNESMARTFHVRRPYMFNPKGKMR